MARLRRGLTCREKPLAHTLESAERIAAAAEVADGFCMVGFNNRFADPVEVLKNYQDEGRFGEMKHVEANYVRRRGIPGRGSWFTSKDVAGGGSLSISVSTLSTWRCTSPAIRTSSRCRVTPALSSASTRSTPTSRCGARIRTQPSSASTILPARSSAVATAQRYLWRLRGRRTDQTPGVLRSREDAGAKLDLETVAALSSGRYWPDAPRTTVIETQRSTQSRSRDGSSRQSATGRHHR